MKAVVTKAFITELPDPGDNHFKVRVPILEDNTGDNIIMSALLCSQPGEWGGYQVGDCVFVTFEGDKHMDESPIGEVAVIIGKLYQDEVEVINANHNIRELTVTGQANLPNNIKIGDYTAKDISILLNGVGYLTDSLEKFSSLDDESKEYFTLLVKQCIDDYALIIEKIKEIENSFNYFNAAIDKIADKLNITLTYDSDGESN